MWKKNKKCKKLNMITTKKKKKKKKKKILGLSLKMKNGFFLFFCLFVWFIFFGTLVARKISG